MYLESYRHDLDVLYIDTNDRDVIPFIFNSLVITVFEISSTKDSSGMKKDI